MARTLRAEIWERPGQFAGYVAVLYLEDTDGFADEPPMKETIWSESFNSQGTAEGALKRQAKTYIASIDQSGTPTKVFEREWNLS